LSCVTVANFSRAGQWSQVQRAISPKADRPNPNPNLNVVIDLRNTETPKSF